jgi:hypothetical protein
MGARIDPRSHRRAALFAVLFSAFAIAITACSSESNPKPPDTNFTTSSGTSSSATGTGGAGGGSASSSSATGTGGAGGAPNCDGPNGCYSCPPKTGAQLLNACTTSQCSPFDNVARLPLYNNGTLPPIP